jgi:hypothetical protein
MRKIDFYFTKININNTIMGSLYSSDNSHTNNLQQEKPAVENLPKNKRQGKWVKFSGSDEELGKIALDHAKCQAARRRSLLKQISHSMSRRTGFNCQEKFDTVCEHWCWSPNNSYGDKLQLQGVNCSVCGNYICISNPKIPIVDRIKCKCSDGLEEFAEYEYGSNYELLVPTRNDDLEYS